MTNSKMSSITVFYIDKKNRNYPAPLMVLQEIAEELNLTDGQYIDIKQLRDIFLLFSKVIKVKLIEAQATKHQFKQSSNPNNPDDTCATCGLGMEENENHKKDFLM